MCFFPAQTNNFSLGVSLFTTHSFTKSAENEVVGMNRQPLFIASLLQHSARQYNDGIDRQFGRFLGKHTRLLFTKRERADLRKVSHYLFGSLAVNGIFSSLLNLPSRLALTVIRLSAIPVSATPACHVLVPSGFACNILNAVTLSLMAIHR